MNKMLIALVAALALTGCAVPRVTIEAVPQTPSASATTIAEKPSATPTEEATEEATAEETEEYVSDDDRFEEMIVTTIGIQPTKGEMKELRKLGHSTCEAIDRGVDKDQMIELMLGQNISPKSRTGKLVMAAMVAGTMVYCPEYSDFFTDN